MVEANTLRQGERSKHRRFFLSSLVCSAQEALTKVRQHWSIENQQHYPLAVLFHEDASRNRKGFLAQNVAALRRLSLNLLNLDTATKLSKPRKRLKALLDDNYLLSLLGIQLSH
jgi:predicted transposase YbfD/YdcC